MMFPRCSVDPCRLGTGGTVSTAPSRDETQLKEISRISRRVWRRRTEVWAEKPDYVAVRIEAEKAR
jgi:hypothetical protein